MDIQEESVLDGEDLPAAEAEMSLESTSLDVAEM